MKTTFYNKDCFKELKALQNCNFCLKRTVLAAILQKLLLIIDLQRFISSEFETLETSSSYGL